MPPNGFIESPEEVESQDGVFVPPSADGLAAIGGDEAAARCACCHVVI